MTTMTGVESKACHTTANKYHTTKWWLTQSKHSENIVPGYG